jgi:hypothetical protein
MANQVSGFQEQFLKFREDVLATSNSVKGISHTNGEQLAALAKKVVGFKSQCSAWLKDAGSSAAANPFLWKGFDEVDQLAKKVDSMIVSGQGRVRVSAEQRETKVQDKLWIYAVQEKIVAVMGNENLSFQERGDQIRKIVKEEAPELFLHRLSYYVWEVAGRPQNGGDTFGWDHLTDDHGRLSASLASTIIDFLKELNGSGQQA